jgi:phage shock protein E
MNDNEAMNITLVIIVIGAIVVFFLLKQAGQLSPKNAEQLIKAGAVVIDVRSAPEFSSGHLANAVNFPLDRLDEIPKKIPDQSTPLLLHCQSGMRSGMAKKRLSAMGYTNVHNLGSYYRAAELLRK